MCVIPCVPRSLESCFDSLKPLFQTCVSGFSQTSLPKNLTVHHKCPFQNSFLIAMCTCFDRFAHAKFSDKPRHGNEQQRAWHRWLPLLPHRPRAQGSQTGSCVKSSWNWKKPRSPKWRKIASVVSPISNFRWQSFLVKLVGFMTFVISNQYSVIFFSDSFRIGYYSIL